MNMLQGTYAVPKKVVWVLFAIWVIDGASHDAANAVSAIIFIVCALILAAKVAKIAASATTAQDGETQ